MRFAIKLLVPLAVLLVLALGLLPPLFARGTLDTDAVNAARAGSSALGGAGSGALTAVEAAVQRSIAGKSGVGLVSVKINPDGQSDTVQVTLAETVHTFMDGIPGLEGWFHLTSTQQSSLGQ